MQIGLSPGDLDARRQTRPPRHEAARHVKPVIEQEAIHAQPVKLPVGKFDRTFQEKPVPAQNEAWHVRCIAQYDVELQAARVTGRQAPAQGRNGQGHARKVRNDGKTGRLIFYKIQNKACRPPTAQHPLGKHHAEIRQTLRFQDRFTGHPALLRRVRAKLAAPGCVGRKPVQHGRTADRKRMIVGLDMQLLRPQHPARHQFL